MKCAPAPGSEIAGLDHARGARVGDGRVRQGGRARGDEIRGELVARRVVERLVGLVLDRFAERERRHGVFRHLLLRSGLLGRSGARRHSRGRTAVVGRAPDREAGGGQHNRGNDGEYRVQRATTAAARTGRKRRLRKSSGFGTSILVEHHGSLSRG